jgi:hypothetical protein
MPAGGNNARRTSGLQRDMNASANIAIIADPLPVIIVPPVWQCIII